MWSCFADAINARDALGTQGGSPSLVASNWVVDAEFLKTVPDLEVGDELGNRASPKEKKPTPHSRALSMIWNDVSSLHPTRQRSLCQGKAQRL